MPVSIGTGYIPAMTDVPDEPAPIIPEPDPTHTPTIPDPDLDPSRVIPDPDSRPEPTIPDPDPAAGRADGRAGV